MHPELRTRREFVRSAALGGALAWSVPTFLARTWDALGAEAERMTQPVTGKDGPILVVVQLAGGNDGLNTVIPFADDSYHRARRRLSIPAADVLRINDQLGFHPALRGLQALYGDGHLAVVQGAGYPNPNRSHFRSMEIWQTGSDADRFAREGWLGRYFDHACAGSDPTVGVNLGRQMPQAFTAKQPTGIALEAGGRGPGTQRRGVGGSDLTGDDAAMAGTDTRNEGASIDGLSGPSASSGAVLDFLDRTALDAQVSSAKVRKILARSGVEGSYPVNRLGRSLQTVAQLIRGGLATRVYYVSHGGFDTHTNQATTQARLLGEFGDGMKAFVEDLKRQGQLRRVLVMAFSEFGRRVAENASGGTDHGAAGLMFLFGERFRTPLLGRYPGLAVGELVNGDLQFAVDFRSVYAGVLEHWLKTASERVLERRFEPLAFV